MSAIGPLRLPSTLLWTSNPNGAIVACDIISKLVLALGRNPYRAWVPATPMIDLCRNFVFLLKLRTCKIVIVKTKHD